MISTRLRLARLKLLRAVGVTQFVATSGFGHPFVCHVGDVFGENPYYDARLFAAELYLAAEWLLQEREPVVVDAGANVGFWCTQLAQMTASVSSRIYSFEPVPQTFCKLVRAITTLALADRIQPVASALSDGHALMSLSVNDAQSGFAQASNGALNARAGDRLSLAVSMPLDHFLSESGVTPSLVKIDVEGSEVAVLRGARRLLESVGPAVLFELNPLTLAEKGLTTAAVVSLLPGYDFCYVDDFAGQRLPFGEAVADPATLDWVCNLFAVPSNAENGDRFRRALKSAQSHLAMHPVGTR